MLEPFHKLKARWKLQRKQVIVALFEKKGKRYLAVCKCNWRGKEWTRRFEIVDEVNEHYDKIPFRPNATD